MKLCNKNTKNKLRKLSPPKGYILRGKVTCSKGGSVKWPIGNNILIIISGDKIPFREMIKGPLRGDNGLKSIISNKLKVIN